MPRRRPPLPYALGNRCRLPRNPRNRADTAKASDLELVMGEAAPPECGWERGRGMKDGVEAFRVTDRLSYGDRTKLMSGTASPVYDWSPSKA